MPSGSKTVSKTGYAHEPTGISGISAASALSSGMPIHISRAPPNATLFLHFSGSGGTAVVHYARSLPWMRVPDQKVTHGTNANLGCASGYNVHGHPNNFGVIAGAGVNVGHNMRCPCSELYSNAQKYNFWGAENPVMAALDCPHIEYWTVLRHPVERILSRVFRPHFKNGHPVLRFNVGVDEMRRVMFTNYTMHGKEREFSTGAAWLNNFYTRSLCGPSVFLLPLGMVTDRHLTLATAQLERIGTVLPTRNISQLPELLSRNLGRCVMKISKVGHEHSHPGSSTWHATERDKAMKDKDFMEALARYNRLDLQLYEHARQLFEHRMHALKSPC